MNFNLKDFLANYKINHDDQLKDYLALLPKGYHVYNNDLRQQLKPGTTIIKYAIRESKVEDYTQRKILRHDKEMKANKKNNSKDESTKGSKSRAVSSGERIVKHGGVLLSVGVYDEGMYCTKDINEYWDTMMVKQSYHEEIPDEKINNKIVRKKKNIMLTLKINNHYIFFKNNHVDLDYYEEFAEEFC
jgi:hypothetical protein